MQPRKSPSITIVGGMTLDMVLWVPDLPKSGEISHARRGEFFSGGKGFNQAICARRCGAEVNMVGVLGNDPFASIFLDTFEDEGVNTTHISRAPVGTSLTFPLFHPRGEHALIGLPRSNRYLYPEDVLKAESIFAASDAVILQFEIPTETALKAVELAKKHNAALFVNPSPVREDFITYLSSENGGNTKGAMPDWLILNQKEAEKISGLVISSVEDAAQQAHMLFQYGIKEGVVITMEKNGAVLVSAEASLHQPAFPIQSNYPIGAGDAFLAAFAVRVLQDATLEDALRFASAAGALAASRYGGGDSQPSLIEIQRLLASFPDPKGK